MEDFQRKYDSFVEIINAELKNKLSKIVYKDTKTLYDAFSYSALAPGKRIRPVLTLAFAEVFGVNIEKALPYAVSLEMIHTYSLIHDDMPSLDNDDLRRGLPTCHKKFGEGEALLAGDALLNKAFEVALSAAALDGVAGTKATLELAKRAGADGMVGGQIIDLLHEGKTFTQEELLLMYKLKTGMLLDAPCAIIIELAKDNGSLNKNFDNMACNAHLYTEGLGLAFQIKDDILDVVGDTKLLGKNIGSDEKDKKTTMVTLLGLEGAERMVSEKTNQSLLASESFGEKGAFLKWIAEKMLTRNV